jgi:hypothetical protein
MRTKRYPVKLAWLKPEVIGVLSDQWQTSPIIASQIIWPPETHERENSNRKQRESQSRSKAGTTAGFVCRVLFELEKRGVCERREIETRLPGSTARNEFKIKRTKAPRGWKKHAVLAAISSGRDPFTIGGIPRNTVSQYLRQIKHGRLKLD